MSTRPTPAERRANPDAQLSRTDLRELGLERRAVDAVFRALPVVVLPGYSRPLVRVSDYLELLERSTYDGARGALGAPSRERPYLHSVMRRSRQSPDSSTVTVSAF